MNRYVEAIGTLLLLTLASDACGSTPPPRPPPPQGPSWNCPFPEEADKKAIDSAYVFVVVYVAVNGVPQSVTILQDPGYGFAQAAVQCAMTKLYIPPKDSAGNPTAGWTLPIRIHYTR
jgi:hypothetical protein